MGDANQLLFVRRHASRLSGPYLEVGSKDYGNTQDLRSLFVGKGAYIGVDLEPGPGVDVVLDLAGDFPAIDAALGGRRFGTAFCLSVLEHVEQPFRMADNLSALLAPGGYLCVGVPFAFKFHGYPSDYWRFTHEGVKKLFPNLHFPADDGCAATSRTGDFLPLDDHVGRIDFSARRHWRNGRVLRAGGAAALRAFSALGLFRWFTSHRYVLAPTMILMIGCRPHATEESRPHAGALGSLPDSLDIARRGFDNQP